MWCWRVLCGLRFDDSAELRFPERVLSLVVVTVLPQKLELPPLILLLLCCGKISDCTPCYRAVRNRVSCAASRRDGFFLIFQQYITLSAHIALLCKSSSIRDAADVMLAN